MPNITEVVAALIWKQEAGERKLLICQRPAHKTRGLLWEFVGGKTEQGESSEQALIRECREELGITVRPLQLWAELTHAYPDLTVLLKLYRTEITEGEPQLLEHHDLRWITPEEIPQYEFCPADEEILIRLRHESAAEKIPLGKWRHFKGGEYEVLGIARDSETQAPLVVYRALYGNGALWVRPAEMWLEQVERNGKLQPRFSLAERSR